MDTDVSTHTQHRLERLHHWLSIGGSSSVLFLAIFLIPQLVLSVLLAIAVFFAPYMLWVLYTTGHHRWIVGFAVMVMLPVMVSWAPVGSLMLSWFLKTAAMISFFLYCWALRNSVGQWVEKIRWLQQVDA